ncbi:hypothetical protein SLW70_00360 [Flavobacterium sp. NG2]|uniref:hypothetical protein n=1 Tax=Flavobacterium sp. NG2 TaxID=3097547 RepID=UPI002A82E1CB|nr:hypothetical protein [Flavobacterium sp. NG2]WPR71611.1 hypothetical protein SLW70_00360 [Flavobacterium sp. NG2]
MDIFVPHEKDRNIYLDEIIFFSNHNFIFDNYKNYKESYSIVNIQFPEAIFDWKSPSQEQLLNFEKELISWKKRSKIIYTLNDFESHYDEKKQFLDLFRLLYKYVDGVIHLGNYSLDNFKKYFPDNCLHKVIFHPLYNSLNDNFKTKKFQDMISADLSNKFIVSVVGSVRSQEELDFIIKIFRKIPIANKFLIVPRVLKFNKIPDYIPTRFRKYYKKMIEKRGWFLLSKKRYYFMSQFIEYNYLVDLVKQSSLMIIPRIRSLNSGNLYLGLTFDKPMIIPEIGNLTETAKNLKLPLLNFKKGNYKEVISEVLSLESNQYFTSNDYLAKKSMYHPRKIAHDYDVFFNKIKGI